MPISTLAAVVLSFVFLTPACGLLFRCGCQTLWGGAAVLCNINIGPPPPCPWCHSMPLGAMGAVIAATPLFLPWVLSRKRQVPVWMPLVLIIPGYLLAGLMTFLLTSYPHFLIRGLRGMLGLPAGPFG